jgi:hypothetical protein
MNRVYVPLRKKKADVAEHPKAFRHVGLLINEPLGLGRGALYLVVRWHWETPLIQRTSPDQR